MGELGPGSLTPQQREAMLESMSEMSVAAGPGSEFDDRYGGYFVPGNPSPRAASNGCGNRGVEAEIVHTKT